MGIQKRVKPHLRRLPHSRKQVRVKGHLRIKELIISKMAKTIKQLQRELAQRKVAYAKHMKRKKLEREIRSMKYGGATGLAKDMGRGFKIMGRQAASGFAKATREGGYLDKLSRQSASRKKKGRRQSAFGIDISS